jgi:translation elongation factor EF-G
MQKKQTGGAGQYAKVVGAIEPMAETGKDVALWRWGGMVEKVRQLFRWRWC